MKNKTLKFEKFRVSKLENYKSVLGGNGDPEDGTGDRPKKPVCIEYSAVMVYEVENNYIKEISNE